VIVGYDGSDGSEDALSLGRILSTAAGAALVVGHVLAPGTVRAEPTGGRSVAVVEPGQSDAEGVVGDLRPLADSLGADVAATVDRDGARGLLDLVEEHDANLLVVGSSKQAASGRVFAGRLVDSLLRHAPCPVAIAPSGFRDQQPGVPRVVGVAFDGSPDAERALKAGQDLALRAEATMRVLAVASPELSEHSRSRLADRVNEARDQLPAELRAAALLLDGPSVPAILDELDKGIHVLFVGTRGLGQIRRAVMGSVSSALARAAACPVIVIPQPPQANEH
jgi:nucleotide-binding universal stress UspA family protein